MNQNYNASFDSFDPNGFEPTPEKKGHARGFSIAALCLGIAAIVCCCICCCLYYVAAPLAIVAIIMACLAKRDNNGKMSGMAVAGLILAIVAILFFLCILAFEIAIFSMDDTELQAVLDEFFEENYGMSFEEFINSYENTYEDPALVE